MNDTPKRRGRRTAKELIAKAIGTESDNKVFESVGETLKGSTNHTEATEAVNAAYNLSLCVPSVRGLLREGKAFAEAKSRTPKGWGRDSSAMFLATRKRGRMASA